MNKEQIYDEKISPLMSGIIAICKEHGIAMIASYELVDEDGEELGCTTCLADETGVIPERLKQAQSAVYQERSTRGRPLMLTTSQADGSKTLTAILG